MILRYFEDLDDAEIARLMVCDPVAVRVDVRRPADRRALVSEPRSRRLAVGGLPASYVQHPQSRDFGYEQPANSKLETRNPKLKLPPISCIAANDD